jgi:hypothetical protein
MVENYLSFKEKTFVNFVAGTIKEYSENTFYPYYSAKEQLLKSIGLFGHNGNGKSNLIKAVSFMRDFVLNSSKESNSSQPIRVQPFKLSTTTENHPSSFEMIFVIEEVKYRYGFTVTNKSVESEWLFVAEKKKEDNLFVRAGQSYNFEKSFKVGLKGKFEIFSEVTRSNTLFLSVLAQFNSPVCQRISDWFNELILAYDNSHFDLIDFTASLMTVSDYRNRINNIIKKSELGIENVEERLKEDVSKNSFSEFISLLGPQEGVYKVLTSHFQFDKENKIQNKIYFDLIINESLGTQKFFGILGPILLALKTKKVIFIDEMDARLNSHLLDQLVSLFNSEKYNPNGAQLIFTSHNTNVLKKGLRRDQMVMVEKDMYGVTTMHSVYAKDPKVRNDASFDKDFLLGKYGAIPKLGSQLNLFDEI